MLLKIIVEFIAVDRQNLADNEDFIALKAEAAKLDLNKLVNFLGTLNNLKTKKDDSNFWNW